jgi:hypothetical protein
MKPARLAVLTLIMVLLVADLGGAWYLRELWQARHGGSANRPPEAETTRTGAIVPPAAPAPTTTATL